jgi:hypothetical protein
MSYARRQLLQLDRARQLARVKPSSGAIRRRRGIEQYQPSK